MILRNKTFTDTAKPTKQGFSILVPLKMFYYVRVSNYYLIRQPNFLLYKLKHIQCVLVLLCAPYTQVPDRGSTQKYLLNAYRVPHSGITAGNKTETLALNLH